MEENKNIVQESLQPEQLKPYSFKKNNLGKPKGAVSRYTKAKAHFLNVFYKLGGEEELYRWAKRSDYNQTLFYKLFSGMLPKETKIDLENKRESKLVLVFNQPENVINANIEEPKQITS